MGKFVLAWILQIYIITCVIQYQVLINMQHHYIHQVLNIMNFSVRSGPGQYATYCKNLILSNYPREVTGTLNTITLDLCQYRRFSSLNWQFMKSYWMIHLAMIHLWYLCYIEHRSIITQFLGDTALHSLELLYFCDCITKCSWVTLNYQMFEDHVFYSRSSNH